MINKVSPLSFKSYVPVTYYARNIKKNGEFVQVKKPENIKKCQNTIVRTLNNTKKLSNEEIEFVDFYKQYDKDYRYYPHVNSVIDDKTPEAIMVTGYDAATISDLGRKIGIAHNKAYEIGINPTYAQKQASKDFFSEVKSYLKINNKQLKSKDGEKLALRVYFNPIYYTKGDKKGQLNRFEFLNARFVKDE